jgi:serine/threonine-protein kinase
LADQLEALLHEHQLLSRERFLEDAAGAMPRPTGLAGQVLGAYTLVSQIGHGGMGSVWLAERNDGRFDRRVAIKFLNIALMGQGGEERFRREGKILGRMSHPNIADLVDAGVSRAGQPYLVLEHIEGDHIDRYCDLQKLDVSARLRLFLDVLKAVAHAHTNLIVHRDLKPSNVLVRTDGQAKLLDFGIAKLLEGEAQSLTMESVRAMTPEYAAPEQLSGGAVTTATDIYALGVLLYVLLTGHHPAGPRRKAAADLVKAIVDTDPQRPSEAVTRNGLGIEETRQIASQRSTTPEKLSKLLRGDLDNIIAKALKKSPEERYSSAIAMADDIRRYLRNEPISARPDTLTYRWAKFVRRNKTAVILALLASVATIAGVTGTLVESSRARRQRDFALRQLSRAEAINDLDNFLLTDAAPSGKPFTVNELLERAEHLVQRQRGPNPADRAELLISIGNKYAGQDEDGKARNLLQQAYQLSRGLTDPSIRAQSSCALGGALASSDLPRAELLINEGLRELSDDGRYTLDRVSCLLNGSKVARERGDAQQAIARTQQAQRLLAASPLRSETTDLRGLMALAESYRAAGQYREAIPTFEQALALMSALGRDDTENAGTLLNNWALALHLSGRPIEAEKLFRRAMDISSADQSGKGISPMLLTNYARTLRELARPAEAADYAERGFARAKESGDEVVINQALLLRARIYRDQGNFGRSQQMLDEVSPRLHKALPSGHLAFATLSSEYSLLAMARHDLPEALKQVNQALSITENSVAAGHHGEDYLPILLLYRSDVERQMSKSEPAVADANRALELLLKSGEPGDQSSQIGRAYFTLGQSLRDQHESEKACSAFGLSADYLQSTVGPGHPDAIKARAAQQAQCR